MVQTKWHGIEQRENKSHAHHEQTKANYFGNTTLNLQYNDIDMCMTSCDKILGSHVDHNLTWHTHFKFLSKNVSSYLWLLSKIRTYVSIDNTLLFFNAYINLILIIAICYGAIVLTRILTKSLSYNAERARYFKVMSSYLKGALEKLKMLSFDQSVFLSKAKMMYKIHNNLVPSYLH